MANKRRCHIGRYCCVQHTVSARARKGLRWPSDEIDEFVESVGDSEVLVSADSEFVAAWLWVLHERVTTDHDRFAPIYLQTAHWSQPRLQPTVVALDTVVDVLLGVRESLRDLFLDQRLRRLCGIGNDLHWFVLGEQRGLEVYSGA